ncbi:MAG: hydrogenase large subunit [Sulfuricurvum sp.]
MRLIARYAKEKQDYFELITVFDTQTEKQRITKEHPHTDSIATQYPSALWFERKIHDDFGIVFDGSFDNRSLVHQESFPPNVHPMRKSFTQKTLDFAPYKAYKYEEIRGDGVFCVSVGPIHAGIIEPGHFHFSQAGEDMLHQEVRHFYKYRGIEKMCEGKTLFEAKAIIERISGNESIAYQIAWRDIAVRATAIELPLPLRKYHALLLELERVVHHLTDLGFIANDGGFGAALAWGSKLAEDVRRKLKQLTSHRFGFGAITFAKPFLDTAELQSWSEQLEKEVLFFEEWISDIPSVWDRFDTTGILTRKKCLKYGVVGVMARASGMAYDTRAEPFYVEHGFEIVTQTSGDVAARFKLRFAEVKNSLKMIRSLMEESPCALTTPISTVQDGEYEAFVESSLGELYMAVEIVDGVIERFFVRDPSFINWQVLHTMMPGNIIADFPLINKSCDLSYAGNDL